MSVPFVVETLSKEDVQFVVETLSKEELQKLLRYSENAVPVFYGCDPGEPGMPGVIEEGKEDG